ncbi:MAG: hypothetical protein QOG10_1721 [Kribbellaceae bacterium]|nr:hypothetical protein [Kribbellaceae bacterium]
MPLPSSAAPPTRSPRLGTFPHWRTPISASGSRGGCMTCTHPSDLDRHRTGTRRSRIHWRRIWSPPSSLPDGIADGDDGGAGPAGADRPGARCGHPSGVASLPDRATVRAAWNLARGGRRGVERRISRPSRGRTDLTGRDAALPAELLETVPAGSTALGEFPVLLAGSLVEAYERRIESYPKSALRGLTTMLIELADRLSDLGRAEQAIAAAQRALETAELLAGKLDFPARASGVVAQSHRTRSWAGASAEAELVVCLAFFGDQAEHADLLAYSGGQRGDLFALEGNSADVGCHSSYGPDPAWGPDPATGGSAGRATRAEHGVHH